MRESGSVAPDARVPVSEHGTDATPTLNRVAAWMRLLTLDPSQFLFVLGASGLLALSLIGLPLAILGIFRPWIVLVPTVIVWAFLANYGLKIARFRTTRATMLSSTVALVVALAFSVFTAANSSEHLFTNRDPGVYFVTGRWLAAHGNLLYTTGLPEPVSENSGRRWPEGVYGTPANVGYFQFQHAPAVTLAVGKWVGGDWLMFRTMSMVAGIALLGVYVLGSNLAGPVFGLIPVTVAALHPAFVHVAKDGYSEFLAMVFAIAALWMWRRANTKGRLGFFSTGVLLGAPTLARIDGWLVGLGFLAGILYLVTVSSRPGPRRIEIAWMLAGYFLTAGLGLLDLLLRSPEYLEDLASSAVPMILAFAAAGGAVLFGSKPIPLLQRLGGEFRHTIPLLISIGLVVAGVYGLFIRPITEVATTNDPIPLVAGLQEREGVPIEPERIYSEMSLEWQARYQGYVPISFAFIAVGVAAYAILKRADSRVPILLTMLAVSAVYFWRPSITPDHLWAMRRFVPVVLPLGFIVTAVGARLILRLMRRQPWASLGIAVVLALALAHSAIVGWPLAAIRTQVGLSRVVEQICSHLGPDSVVLTTGQMRSLAGAVRTGCDVPVTSSEDANIVDQVVEAGFEPVIIAPAEQCGPTSLGSIAQTFEFPERTLTQTPDEPEAGTVRLTLTDPTMADDPELIANIPDGADAVLLVEMHTTWTPASGSSVVAALGGYHDGMWLEYRPSGIVELWITTDEGQTGTVASPRVDDGQSRVIGGYLEDGVLYGTCGGQVTSSRPLIADPLISATDVEHTPVHAGDHGNQEFMGEVEVVSAIVDPTVIGQD
jgi:hypothetical protein